MMKRLRGMGARETPDNAGLAAGHVCPNASYLAKPETS